jgi:hypothetical protein
MQGRLSIKKHKVPVLKATFYNNSISELAIEAFRIFQLYWLVSLSVLSGLEQMKNLSLLIELSYSVDIERCDLFWKGHNCGDLLRYTQLVQCQIGIGTLFSFKSFRKAFDLFAILLDF